ncbi:hypothetical protein B0H10DRAFT_734358 [Mycena sp. CBHHK59/15]|nr:hypothetical protein B0H10DRAFT_734358 [Mycena sp. CBHHK59/15]
MPTSTKPKFYVDKFRKDPGASVRFSSQADSFALRPVSADDANIRRTPRGGPTHLHRGRLHRSHNSVTRLEVRLPALCGSPATAYPRGDHLADVDSVDAAGASFPGRLYGQAPPRLSRCDGVPQVLHLVEAVIDIQHGLDLLLIAIDGEQLGGSQAAPARHPLSLRSYSHVRLLRVLPSPHTRADDADGSRSYDAGQTREAQAQTVTRICAG